MSANPTTFHFDSMEDGNRITVRFPTGTALTESNADELFRSLSALVENREQAQLDVDLRGVTALTSAILSKLLTLNKQLRAAGGHLALLNPAQTIQLVFKVSRLDTVLDIRTGAAEVPA